MRLDQQVKCIALLVTLCGLAGTATGCSVADGDSDATVSPAIDERAGLAVGDGVCSLADAPTTKSATRRPKDTKEAGALRSAARLRPRLDAR